MNEDEGDRQERIDGLASKPAGFDAEDPYTDVNLADLPRWWRETVEEFRAYGLRPFRPSRFENGVVKHTVVEPIEQELDVDIRFTNYGVHSETWTVLLDGEPVGEIGHHRVPEGFSVFEMDSDSFELMVRQTSGQNNKSNGDANRRSIPDMGWFDSLTNNGVYDGLTVQCVLAKNSGNTEQNA